MCASTPTSAVRWKRLFLILEAFVILACVYGLTLKITWRYNVGWHPYVMSVYRVLYPLLRPMFFSFLAASVFLLLGSPFFLRSLRSKAIRAWIIGVAALLCAGWLFFVLW
jgi:hypothetical protein